jgi:hypothetical protein
MGKSFEMMKLVLEDAFVQVSADADVERAGEAAQDVDAIGFAVSGHRARIMRDGARELL